MKYISFFLLLVILGCKDTTQEKISQLQEFILIKGQQFEKDGKPIQIDDFEILDHPVSNKEYKAFIDATGYVAPLHWENGEIPSSKEDFPVIFVNREDVNEYTLWLTKTTGRVHRIPTQYEYEFAARGGVNNDYRYYWGNSEEELSNDDVNCNLQGDRVYDEWEEWLKPVMWGKQNSKGLYQMHGNVWQFVTTNADLATAEWQYRTEAIYDLEYMIMGGSWASTKEYLSCDEAVTLSPGTRSPDVGIRLVREPENRTWEVKNRKVVAVPHPDGGIGISWALLGSDTRQTKFNIYRLEGKHRMHKGLKLNAEPLYATSYLDNSNTQKGVRYQYRVYAIDETGKESNPSDWAAIAYGDDIYPIVAKFKPVLEKGRMAPVFGDLEGYGKLGCVIRLDNGNKEMTQDSGIPVQLEAFSYTGRSLWRKNIANHENIYGSSSNAPFNVWDMDGDGKDEVITLFQIGEDNYLTVLDGMSGKILHKTLWDKMATDFSKSSTRIQMSIAYLDGVSPSIITQTGVYENEILSAYDKNLNKLWTYESFMETSGSSAHKVEIADVDNDGKQEVLYGTTCLNHDGTLRWSIYKQHADKVFIHDYIPDREGLEVCYIVESNMHAGIYMVDASSGEIIWKNNKEEDPAWTHGHHGWTSDIWDGSPGIECVTNRSGHQDRTLLLFSADGKYLNKDFPSGYMPIEWDGDQTRELLSRRGTTIGNFNGSEVVLIPDEIPNPVPQSFVILAADLCGDFRSEMAISTTDTDGRPAIMVVTAPDTIDKRYITAMDDIVYKLWLARNIGGGYGSTNEYALIDVE